MGLYKIAGIGEILWDIYPDYAKLGGAPTNFTYFVTKMGHMGITLSRIGRDEHGSKALDILKNSGMDSNYIQVDSEHPTGTVDVVLDENAKPSYVINKDVAWDYISLDKSMLLLAENIEVVCFGTIAQRSPVSRKTIQGFLDALKKDTVKIFDINLRQDFYTKDNIMLSIKRSTILKLNSEEIILLKEMTDGEKYRDIDFCRVLIEKYGLELICLTKGENGSTIVNKEGDISEHKGFKVEVKDTVGSGDSFTAAIAVCYLKGLDLDSMNDYANRIASWTASKEGGTPEPDDRFDDILGLY